MATITNNRTRYSTKDLLALLTWFESSIEEMIGEGIWTPPETIVVRTISLKRIGTSSGVKFSQKSNGYYSRSVGKHKAPNIWETQNGSALRIVAPANLPDDDDPSRTAVHAWKDTRPPMPLSVLREIVSWYWSCGKMSHIAVSDHHEDVVNFIQAAGREVPPIYVDNRIHNPVKSVKATKERKIERAAQMHGDTSTRMKGSSRTPQYHWKNTVYWAGEYYNREWERRECWRQKILDLGGEQPKHETFAEYLIYIGTYLKQHGRMPL